MRPFGPPVAPRGRAEQLDMTVPVLHLMAAQVAYEFALQAL
jgi:hypothetical protein